MNAKAPNLDSEYVTGDQSERARRRRGRRRWASWELVDAWRARWTPEKVRNALVLLASRASAEEIGSATGFGTIQTSEGRTVPNVRGLDLALLEPAERRQLLSGPTGLDWSYFHLEGARLTDLVLRDARLYRARLEKATLRRVDLTGADLTKTHFEDADLREANLTGARLGHIRYTEDGFWWKGTVLMETTLRDAFYVDPLLQRCADDQYYLSVLKYRNWHSRSFRVAWRIWWVTCNFGKSTLLWALWAGVLALVFAGAFYMLGPKHFTVANLGWGFGTMLYYSIVTFTTLGFGDIAPRTGLAAALVTFEVIIGYVMLGGLISIFANKLARRS